MDRPLTKRPPPAPLIAHRTSHGHDANASRGHRDTQGGRTYEAATYNRCLLSPMRTPSIAELSRTRSRQRHCRRARSRLRRAAALRADPAWRSESQVSARHCQTGILRTALAAAIFYEFRAVDVASGACLLGLRQCPTVCPCSSYSAHWGNSKVFPYSCGREYMAAENPQVVGDTPRQGRIFVEYNLDLWDGSANLRKGQPSEMGGVAPARGQPSRGTDSRNLRFLGLDSHVFRRRLANFPGWDFSCYNGFLSSSTPWLAAYAWN